jgi:hypothetical protein
VRADNGGRQAADDEKHALAKAVGEEGRRGQMRSVGALVGAQSKVT